MGSGTTLLESALRHRRAIGVDLNPLAVLISRAKTTPIPEYALNGLLDTLGNSVAMNGVDSQLPLFPETPEGRIPGPEHDPRFINEWYCKWFQPRVLKELLAIDSAIREVAAPALRDIARVAFSDILRRSSNAHSGYPECNV